MQFFISFNRLKNNHKFLIIISSISFIISLGFFYRMVIKTENSKEAILMDLNDQRGAIYDRKGKILAMSYPLDNISLWTPYITKPKPLVETLGAVLDIEEDELLGKISDSKQKYIMVKKKITPIQSQELKILLEQGDLMRGVSFEKDYGRVYPYKDLASHILGFVGTDNKGLEGLELSLNETLGFSSDENYLSRGDDVFLTIDIDLHYLLQEIIYPYYEANDPDYIFAAIMKADTGELLAYESLPNFNPNNFSSYTSFERKNRLVSEMYEPGSVFKIFSMASFLESPRIGKNDYFLDTGTYYKEVPNQRPIIIKNALDLSYGRINMEGVLVHSSNVGTSLISELETNDYFYNKLVDFGFGVDTKFPFREESRGLLNKTNKWSARSKATISFGQEIGVTASQILSAATVLSNDGWRLEPQILSKVTNSKGEIITTFEPNKIKKVISKETADDILAMLQQVNLKSNRRAHVPSISTASKTGTAQVINEQGQYSKEDYFASILGYIPANKPEYIIYIGMRHPKGESTFGAAVAAPIARDIIEMLISYYNMDVKNKEVMRYDSDFDISVQDDAILDKIMPDVINYSLKEVMDLKEVNKNYNISINGRGYVYKQSPPKGTPLKKGMPIVFDLK